MGKKRRRSRRNGQSWLASNLKYIALVAVAAVTAGLVVSTFNQQAPVTAARNPYSGNPVTALSAHDADERPVALFLGDSFAEGGQVTKAQRYATLLGGMFDWKVDNRSEGGTGYITDGPAEFPDRQPFPGRVADAVAAGPDVVFVAGGINDAGRNYTAAQIEKAVRDTLEPLKAGLPDATIYVIGPFWPNGFPTQSVLSVRDTVSAVAGELGLSFIDPLADPWITGSNDGKVAGNRAEVIGPDGTHPTAVGHAMIAERIAAAIKGG